MPQVATASTLDYLPAVIERIVRQFDPVRIILFGSHARGDARWDSDLDLLVVLRQAPDRRKAAVEVARVLNGLPISTDVIVTTPEHLAEYGHVNGLIYRDALEEGRVVYDHD